MYKALCLAGVVLAAFALIRYPAKAGAPGTSKGVILIELGCGADPQAGNLFGPATATLYFGYRTCFGEGTAVQTPIPSGTLYNLRAVTQASTSDGSPQKMKVSLFKVGSSNALLVCGANTETGQCQNLTDTAVVNAGDGVYATITVPDSNTQLVSAIVTVEENVVE
jgi:hypothetical protein